MLIAIHGVKLHLINIHGVKIDAHSYTWSDTMRSLLYME